MPTKPHRKSGTTTCCGTGTNAGYSRVHVAASPAVWLAYIVHRAPAIRCVIPRAFNGHVCQINVIPVVACYSAVT